jgi:muramoyltetrapeptide carboxypeptidase LdcA involved in peptidoglycan recycling
MVSPSCADCVDKGSLPDVRSRYRRLRMQSVVARVAGCLEVLDWLRGTAWWPDLEGVVLAIETSEEAPTPDAVQRFLRSLAAMGDLYRIAALLVGRPAARTCRSRTILATTTPS